MYRTEQDRIDAETLRLDNPERVVGSGYIQFPPQVPFSQPITRQPPTLADYETYQHAPGPYSGQPQQRPVGYGTYHGNQHYSGPSQHGGRGHSQQPQYGPGRGYRSSQAEAQQSSGYQIRARPPPAYQANNHEGYANSQAQRSYVARHDGRQPGATNYTQQPHIVAERAPNVVPSIKAESGRQQGSQQSSRPPSSSQEARPNDLVANFRSLVVGDPIHTDSDAHGQDKTPMSKSQAKRHRKKMREGKLSN